MEPEKKLLWKQAECVRYHLYEGQGRSHERRREMRLELREQAIGTSPGFMGVPHPGSPDIPSCPLCSHRQPVAAGVQREGGVPPAVPPTPASARQHRGQVGVHEAAAESAGLLD